MPERASFNRFWLWGGDLDAIYTSINHGIRNDEDEDTRDSQMPAFGTDEILEKEEIRSVVEYVLQVSGQEHKAESAVLGAEIFSDNCAACHGENAQGGREVGAPNLKDAISLYGNTRETLYNQIVQPKHGVMPPWGKRLGDVTVKQLAIYVHSLGGGERQKSVGHIQKLQMVCDAHYARCLLYHPMATLGSWSRLT